MLPIREKGHNMIVHSTMDTPLQVENKQQEHSKVSRFGGLLSGANCLWGELSRYLTESLVNMRTLSTELNACWMRHNSI